MSEIVVFISFSKKIIYSFVAFFLLVSIIKKIK